MHQAVSGIATPFIHHSFVLHFRLKTHLFHKSFPRKRLVKFATNYLMCSCGNSSQMVCNIQLINRLRLWLEFIVLFRHGAPDVVVQRVQIWRVWGQLILFNEPVTVGLQPVLRDACLWAGHRPAWKMKLADTRCLQSAMSSDSRRPTQ